MAKKKAAKKAAKKAPKKSAPKKAAKKATKKAAKKKAAKRKPVEQDADLNEVVLGPEEEKAFDLIESSEQVREQLEKQVTEVAIGAVRDILKQNGIDLSQEQGERLTMVLFG